MTKPPLLATFLAGVLLVLGAVGVSASIASVEAKRFLGDADAVVAVGVPLAEDPLFRQRLGAVVSESAVDAVREQFGLDLPLADRLIERVVADAIASDRFVSLWRQSLIFAQAQLVSTLAEEADALFTIGPDGEVDLQLRPLVAAGRQQLVDDEVPFAHLIPDAEGAVRLARSDLAARIPVYYEWLNTSARALPWASAALFAAALLLPGRRLLRLSAGGFAVAGFALLEWLGLRWAVGRLVATLDAWVTEATVRSAYATAVSSLTSALLLAAAVGALVGVAALVSSLLIERRKRQSA